MTYFNNNITVDSKSNRKSFLTGILLVFISAGNSIIGRIYRLVYCYSWTYILWK